MIDYKLAGERIRKQRKRLGLTQEMLSEKINITPSFYSQIESGKRKASISAFVNLSQTLSISLDYIFNNNISHINPDNFNEFEYKIFYYLQKFSDEQKKFTRLRLCSKVCVNL